MQIKAVIERNFPPHKIADILARYPKLYLRAKTFYFQGSLFSGKIFNGVRLSCYARGKCTFESFSGLGSTKGEVEVKTLQTSLNTGTERAMFYRFPGTTAEFPYTPGASGVGRVVRVGRNVSSLSPGDLVAGPFIHASAQSIAASRLIRLSSELNLEEASMLHLCIIAMQGVRMGRVKEGQRIVVMGQGIIGRLATLLARALGTNEVICITRTREKLRIFKEWQGIATDEIKAGNAIKDLKADVVIDATGDPEAINIAILACRDGGKIVLLGSNRGKTSSFDINGLPRAKGLSIVGAHIRNQHLMPPDLGSDYQGEAEVIQELIKTKKLSLAGVITSKLSCSGLVDYYLKQLSSDRNACGIVVDWSDAANLMKRKIRPIVPEYALLSERIKPLKMALVGCGDIGIKDADAIIRSRGFDLVLVMDTDLSLAKELGDKYRISYTDNFSEIIGNKTINAVMIAVPHYLHALLANQVAQSGKHVLVEKPLAISMEDASSMIKVAQENKVLLRTFFPYSYEYQKRMAKCLVDHDAIGNVMGVSITMYANQSQQYWYGGYRGRSQSNWRTRKELSGGGILLMNLVHTFDYLYYITGIKIKTVFAHYDTLHHPVDVEDTVGLTFRGTKGEIGTVSAGSAVKGAGDDITRLWGENGQILIVGDILKFYSLRPVGSFPAKRWHTIKANLQEDSRILFLDDFRQQIEDGCQTNMSEPGYLALGIIMAAYRAGELNIPVDVDSFLALSDKCRSD
jgi:2-desacetyl-2-hydroxyethyl bacteriochlorophyllide A dehydrogenase